MNSLATVSKPISNLLADLLIAISLFSYGTAMMDYFLLYPARYTVGEAEFRAFHVLLEERIIPVSVLPFFLITILNLLLVWPQLRPPWAPAKWIWLSLICLLLDWVSSIFWQIPMNLKLNEGKDLDLMRQVDLTNWGRVVLETSQAGIVFRLLQLKGGAGRDRTVS